MYTTSSGKYVYTIRRYYCWASFIGAVLSLQREQRWYSWIKQDGHWFLKTRNPINPKLLRRILQKWKEA